MEALAPSSTRPTRRRLTYEEYLALPDDGRIAAAPIDEDGVYHSTVIPGFRLQLDWLRQPEQTDVERALAGMLADAPALSDDLRALYRRMLELL